MHAPKQEQAQREGLVARKDVGEEGSDMEKAADFGRLRTMKVQQASKASLLRLFTYACALPLNAQHCSAAWRCSLLPRWECCKHCPAER